MIITSTLNVIATGDYAEDTGGLTITVSYHDGEGNIYTDDAVLISDQAGLDIDWFDGCPQTLSNILEQLTQDDLQHLDRQAGELT
jgi:hypothetical protein